MNIRLQGLFAWTASRGDFMFSADRLIRLVVEEGLNQLPYKECTVTTPTGYKYEGVKFEKGNCGVSIMRTVGSHILILSLLHT
uniref:Uracil phosphoribosyltransferase homolog n=1 Tax=Castor canadensis TaxID=51338 RepID=A0A8B7UV93_CASCN|nr:uracil phosphoribosyltransferase homolog [Castor canadensis]